MLKSSLCNYSDACILVKGTITINENGGLPEETTEAQIKTARENDERVLFKDCAPFTDCINEFNNTQIDNVKDIDKAMPIYNLI